MNERFERLAVYAWRLVIIAAATAIVVWSAGQLLVVLVPVAVAALVTRGLWPINRTLRKRRLPAAAAAACCLVVFFAVVATAIGLAGAALAGEADDIGPTIRSGIDDITDWLVDDGPFNVSRADVEDVRDEIRGSSSTVLRSSGGLTGGALVAAEIAAGSLLAVIITFFFLKDGDRWVDRVVSRVRPARRELVGRCLRRGWDAAGGFLRGAASLGIVEAVTIGVAMAVVGADLVVAVMVLTFLAAFVPIVGALVAGGTATLVTLATAGPVPALIVAAVALVVQQLDNDLLGPLIYGRFLRMHPLVILLGIAAGGALFGLIGTLFAVPVLAVTVNVVDEWRRGGAPSGRAHHETDASAASFAAASSTSGR